jgi:hypothetical protein
VDSNPEDTNVLEFDFDHRGVEVHIKQEMTLLKSPGEG